MSLPETIFWCAFALPMGLGAGLLICRICGVDLPLAIRVIFRDKP
jgi:hypothetical protein